jgi:hypothetical protein
MPFQPGNSEASKRGQKRRFKAALMRLTDKNPEYLDILAKKLWEQAMTGDVSAVREVADRLDGKVPQAIVGDDEESPVRLERIERAIVNVVEEHAHDSNGKGLPPAS